MTSHSTFVVMCIMQKKIVNTLFLVVEAHVSSYSHGHWLLSDTFENQYFHDIEIKKEI